MISSLFQTSLAPFIPTGVSQDWRDNLAGKSLPGALAEVSPMNRRTA